MNGKQLKNSILQWAIQGKLVPQDPNDEPASVLLERIKEEKAKLFKEGKLKKKDLVDSVIFKGGPRNRTGVVCVANKACSNLILSDKTVRIEYVRDYCNPYYLMFALNSPVIHDNVMSATVGMADSQVNISQNSIQNIAIPLPPYKRMRNCFRKRHGKQLRCKGIVSEGTNYRQRV